MADEMIGIIGGTGLGDALARQLTDVQLLDVDTPFGKPSDKIRLGTFGRTSIAFLNRHGPGHKLPPSRVPYAANIFALKTVGVRAVISSGAVGSLTEHIEPGHLVLVDQFIDKTFKRTNSFFGDLAAVHCEMAEPCCGRLRNILQTTAQRLDLTTHATGTYVCMEGPQFSSRAESLMHKSWGGHLIGMTAMPEAKLAREAQICYALVALASDYDCWRPHTGTSDTQTLLQEIRNNLETATRNCLKLIEAVLHSDRQLVRPDCPCRKSLDLAVWTSPDQIDPAKKAELQVLFE